jgi:hypothetical protein
MKLKTSLLCAALTLAPALRADFIGIYDYFTSLGGVYAAQTGNEKWTFRNGDQNGALMGQYAGSGYGNLGAYAQFSLPADVGLSPAGSAGTNEAAGIFTHTASSGLISAVFHADSTFTAESIFFTHELVGNGNWGNGIDLSLRTVVGGNVVDHGSFSITNILSAQTAFNFGASGLTFNTGDEIVVMFSARGSYLYDHGWWDVGLQKVTGQNGNSGTAVPDSSTTALLMAMGLGVLAMVRRRTPSAACTA